MGKQWESLEKRSFSGGTTLLCPLINNTPIVLTVWVVAKITLCWFIYLLHFFGGIHLDKIGFLLSNLKMQMQKSNSGLEHLSKTKCMKSCTLLPSLLYKVAWRHGACSFIRLFSPTSSSVAPTFFHRLLLIARSWLKRLRMLQLSTVNECGLLTPSRTGVCIQNTRMPSLLKWEGFICHSFHWCCCNDQVCGWWMAWPFPPPYNQVFLLDSFA